MMKKSYYDTVLDQLKATKNTFTDKYPAGFAYYYCVVRSNNQWEAVLKSGEDIFNWARQLGLPIPEGASTGQEADTRIVCKLLEEQKLVANNGIYLAGRDNQLFLSAAAEAETYSDTTGTIFPFKGLFEQAKKVVRFYMEFLVVKAMSVPVWDTGETLDIAVTRMSAYFNNIHYCYKDQDLRYLALSCAWNGLKTGGWCFGDMAIVGFCSRTDVVLKQWIEDHPDFSYDKLYEYNIRNRDAYEAKHGRLPENMHFHETFGAGLKNMKRTFG